MSDADHFDRWIQVEGTEHLTFEYVGKTNKLTAEREKISPENLFETPDKQGLNHDGTNAVVVIED